MTGQQGDPRVAELLPCVLVNIWSQGCMGVSPLRWVKPQSLVTVFMHERFRSLSRSVERFHHEVSGSALTVEHFVLCRSRIRACERCFSCVQAIEERSARTSARKNRADSCPSSRELSCQVSRPTGDPGPNVARDLYTFDGATLSLPCPKPHYVQ